MFCVDIGHFVTVSLTLLIINIFVNWTLVLKFIQVIVLNIGSLFYSRKFAKIMIIC